MSEYEIIHHALVQAARRRRWQRTLHHFWLGLLGGAGIWLGALAIYKFAPVSFTFLLWAGGAALLGPIGGIILGFWRQPSLAETARWVDVKQNLRERLSTALEVATTQPPGTWRDLVMHDAAQRAREVEPKKLVPFSLPGAARWTALLLALAVGLGFVPEYRSPAQVKKQADEQIIKAAGQQVAALTKRELALRPPALETTRQSLETVAELGTRLEKVSLTRSEALKDLANVSDKLKDDLKQLAQDPALKRLAQDARTPGGRDASSASSLQKQIETLQNELAAKADRPEAIESLQRELEKIQQAAQALAQQTGAEAEAARQELASALQNLQQQAAAAGIDLPNLDAALAALASARPDQFLRDIQAALQDLDKLRELKDKLAALQAHAEKLGKDLAEQLKQGQAFAAAETLEKLAQQLQAANLSPEQMEKILAEVSQALPEAMDYGNVADLLKQAAQQMQQGNQSGAAQNLAAAAQELKDLMQQLADADALLAALENLDRASQCVGMGLGWGQCQSRGMGQDFWGQFGRGAGTSSQPSSLSDRSPTEMTDDFESTKVRGQISPNAAMPSITLKGVSIKGASRVQYEEAAAAAQSDAQAALNQDKVPRAYQGAVRDYFDDLKQ
jgi:hypothetical protein